jgi:hypothetical protein
MVFDGLNGRVLTQDPDTGELLWPWNAPNSPGYIPRCRTGTG